MIYLFQIWRKKDINFVQATMIKAKGLILTRNFLDAEVSFSFIHYHYKKVTHYLIFIV